MLSIAAAGGSGSVAQDRDPAPAVKSRRMSARYCFPCRIASLLSLSVTAIAEAIL
jgi:hypothetical protein